MEASFAIFSVLSILFLLRFLSARASRRAFAFDAAGLAVEKRAFSLPSRLYGFFKDCIVRLGRLHPGRDSEGMEELIRETRLRFSVPYFQGLRLASGLLGVLASLPLHSAALLCGPLLFLLGYQLPVFLLKRRRKLRWARVGLDLPEIVDLMAVLCCSGESLLQALAHSTAACAHLSSQAELQEIMERIRFGESTAEALRQAADHPCPELRRFSRVLVRAEEYGSPISDTLEELASEFKAARRETERVKAARGSVLILFPLVFLILPSFLLLTVGGMILGYGL